MPGNYTYPGVYVEEIPSGVRTITGVSTSDTAFVGFFKRGPMETPVRITSFADFERRFGGLDTLVLNAGVVSVCPLEQIAPDHLERVLAVNVQGVLLGLQAALPALRQAESPSVVVTSSISGVAGDPYMYAKLLLMGNETAWNFTNPSIAEFREMLVAIEDE